MSIYTTWFKLKGWTFDNESLTEDVHRCVMIASPHTSNWDFIYMAASFDLLGIKIRFTVKKELRNKPIIGWMLNRFGAIWIDRSPKTPGADRPSMVEVMTELFEKNDKLTLVVTPEGTRGKRTEWKTGFYHVAKNAGVPIALGYLDYKKKRAGVGKIIWPSDDKDPVLREIMEFYNNIAPKHPEDFSVDQRYI